MLSAILDAPVMTTEEFLALPRNGTSRWLIEGQLREKPMTVRNRTHSRLMATIVYLLKKGSSGEGVFCCQGRLSWKRFFPLLVPPGRELQGQNLP